MAPGVVTLPRATGFAAWPAATPSSCGPATAAVCVVRKQAAVMQATKRSQGEPWLAVDGGGAGRWLPGPGGVGRRTPHGQGQSGRCLGETACARVGFRGWASHRRLVWLVQVGPAGSFQACLGCQDCDSARSRSTRDTVRLGPSSRFDSSAWAVETAQHDVQFWHALCTYWVNFRHQKRTKTA